MYDSTSDLAQQALLYLAGELDSPQLESFERQLETDPVAQEQLILAVQLHALLEQKDLSPNPAYRDVVREQLFPQPTREPRPFLRRFLGFSLAASLMIAAVSLSSPDTVPPLVSTTESQVALEESNSNFSCSLETEDRIDMAETWAELSTVEHYQQVSEEDHRRRNRLRDNGQMHIHNWLSESPE